MTDSVQQAAQRILASMKKNYGAPSVRRTAQESDFGHLDLRAYRDFRTQHEAEGFRLLRDFELAEVSDSPTTLIARTFIRAMASADGSVIAYYYQVRPRMDRLLRQLWRGLMNGRWLDTPRFFLKTLKTRHCNDYESECSDGHFITTSNAEAAGKISLPPTVSAEFHPYGTSPAFMLASQKNRLKVYVGSHPGTSACVVKTLNELEAMQDRLKAQKSAHRIAVGWVSQSEMIKLANGNADIAAAVYLEVQRQLHEEKA